MSVDDGDTLEITVHIALSGGWDVGSTPGRIYLFSDLQPVPRHAAFPDGSPFCSLDATPIKSCTFAVPRGRTVTLMATEGDPAVFVRLAPASSQDTVRDGHFVEFTGWTDCPDAADRGMCVLRPTSAMSVEANYQLMQQVTVYQTGAARMDWITFAPAPMLKVPAESDNILDLAGCRRVFTPPAAPCDSVRLIGQEPFHRFTALVPRQTIVGMFPVPGAQTAFVRWDGSCILSDVFPTGTCSLISPSVSGPPILLTLRFQWWDCPGGPSDQDIPGQACVLRGGTVEEETEGRRQ
ncbi:MAG TPA: hypothetical protein VF981_05080 [Gemmatimonadaceae bacterium]